MVFCHATEQLDLAFVIFDEDWKRHNDNSTVSTFADLMNTQRPTITSWLIQLDLWLMHYLEHEELVHWHERATRFIRKAATRLYVGDAIDYRHRPQSRISTLRFQISSGQPATNQVDWLIDRLKHRDIRCHMVSYQSQLSVYTKLRH
jgi:hypothetical protein